MKVSSLFRTGPVGAWLTHHRVAIVGTALCCLGMPCLFPAATSPTVLAGSSVPLSTKVVRRARQAQAARLDSIRQEVSKLPARQEARDSAVTAARRHSRLATYYLHLLSHEATPGAPATEHVARVLANYQPGSYSLDSTHSLW
jgi:hypothetical protein